MVKKLILPVGLVLAALITVWSGAPGMAFRNALTLTPGAHLGGILELSKPLRLDTPLLVIAIFLVSGWHANFRELEFNRRFALVMLTVGAITLVGFPFLGLSILGALQVDPLLAAGFLAILSAPPALTSGIVMTVIANGNMMLAMAITITFNLLAIITMPLMLSYFLDPDAVAGIDGMAMFRTLIYFVLLPFSAGALLRKLFPGRGTWPPVDYIPGVATIILIWVLFAGARDKFAVDNFPVLLLAAGLALGFYALLLILMYLTGRAFRLEVSETKALILCGNTKTVTITVAILTVLHLDATIAVIAPLFFYSLQLFTGSTLAAFLERWGKSAAAPRG